MKLNFWQWIGILIVAVALIVIIRREMGGGPDRTTEPAPPFSPQKAVEVPTTQGSAATPAAPTTGPVAP